MAGCGVTPYYQDDLVTIYHGDCREWMPEADVIVTDPPYGISIVRSDGTTGGQPAHGKSAPNRIYTAVVGDDSPLDPSWMLQRASRLIVWGADHFAEWPTGGRLLIWDKRVGLASNDFADVEVAWDSKPGPSRLFSHRQMGMFHDGYNDDGSRREHPTQKPVALMRWCLSFTEGTVLDPFMGSGSTLVAAKSLGRTAFGIEIEERYCEIAANRCRQEVLGLAL